MSEFSDRLREEFCAVKLRFKWWGVTRAVADVQRATMAQAVSADVDEVRCGKRIINTKNENYRAASKVKSRARSYWQDHSLPYPEDGVRLVKRSFLQEFQDQMTGFVAQLDQAVSALQDCYYTIRQEAREKLGDLFDPNDYPETLEGMFAISWEYPNIDPPEYLRDINDRIYQRALSTCTARLEESVALAEQAFMEEFQKLLGKLVERLTPDANGNCKVFGDGIVENIGEFLSRFRSLNINSNPEFDSLVEQAGRIVSVASPDRLRGSDDFRAAVRQTMENVGTQLDAMMTNRPKRAVVFDD